MEVNSDPAAPNSDSEMGSFDIPNHSFHEKTKESVTLRLSLGHIRVSIIN